MLLKDIIARVQSLYSRGVETDDSALTSRHIYNKLLSVRSLLISQKINKKQKISDWVYQILPCVQMIEVDESMCPCIPPKGCTVMRSKEKIPKSLSGLSYQFIAGVFTPDMRKRFSYSTRKALSFSKGNKYTSGGNKYLIEEGYLYAYGQYVPNYLTVKMILEDPLEVSKFNTCQEPMGPEENCKSPLDREFLIDGDLVEPLIRISIEELIGDFIKIKKDSKTTDNEDDRAS